MFGNNLPLGGQLMVLLRFPQTRRFVIIILFFLQFSWTNGQRTKRARSLYAFPGETRRHNNNILGNNCVFECFVSEFCFGLCCSTGNTTCARVSVTRQRYTVYIHSSSSRSRSRSGVNFQSLASFNWTNKRKPEDTRVFQEDKQIKNK